MALLHIYDADDSNISATASARTEEGARMLVAISGNGANLISALDSLVGGRTYNRVLFETHGSPGRLYFGNASIDSAWVLANMLSRNYDTITPGSTRIYFNGCNVTQGASGSAFMRAIASVFLLRGGGSVFGHTSLGLEIPIYSGLTGHVVHLTGERKTIYVAPGGRVLEELTTDDI
jgi:hypothetical protein